MYNNMAVNDGGSSTGKTLNVSVAEINRIKSVLNAQKTKMMSELTSLEQAFQQTGDVVSSTYANQVRSDLATFARANFKAFEEKITTFENWLSNTAQAYEAADKA